MMDGRCETCRHWYRPVDPANKGLCGLIANTGYHASNRAELRVWQPSWLVRRLRLTLELRTEPDFGCFEWKPHDEASHPKSP